MDGVDNEATDFAGIDKANQAQLGQMLAHSGST